MKNYLKAINEKLAVQTQRSRPDQVENSAGGFVFRVSDEQRFLRFLILGTEGGTFYASEAVQTKLETAFVEAFAAANGERAVEMIVDVSMQNRAPKADPSLVALAAVAKLGDVTARKMAWDALPKIARTGTHLLHFLEFVQAWGGWGRLTREGVARVFETMPLEKLATWSVKYKGRDGWTQADALRLSHPKTADAGRNAIFKFMVDGVLETNGGEITDPALRLIEGHLKALSLEKDADAAAVMREYNLPIEAVPTGARGAKVYRAALETNGLTWTFRNLGNLGKHGVLVPGAWDVIAQVVNRLTDENAIKKGRIHPIQALSAMLTYKSGRGVRGKGEWGVVPQVVDALEKAFYTAFGAVAPTGKRFVLGLDVSGSMESGVVAGVPGLTPRLASTAMAMVAIRTEKNALPFAFSAPSRGQYGGQWGGGDPGFKALDLGARDSLEGALGKIARVPMGGTDCSLPMRWALKNRVQADVFHVYTDNETWAGPVHPFRALEDYRQKMGIGARLVVVGMTATAFTIADPNDAGMLDVVGFDGSAPQVMSAFARGEV